MPQHFKGDELPLTSNGAVGLDEILRASVRNEPDINGMAVTDDQGRVKILLWNYHDILVPSESASIKLMVKLPSAYGSRVQLVHYRIDDTHSNAYTKWLELGSPQNPTADMLAQLKTAMQLQLLEPPRLVDIDDDEVTLNFELPRSGLSLVVLKKRRP